MSAVLRWHLRDVQPEKGRPAAHASAMKGTERCGPGLSLMTFWRQSLWRSIRPSARSRCR